MLRTEVQETQVQTFVVELSSPETSIPWESEEVWAILHTMLRGTNTRVGKVRREITEEES